MVIYFLPCRSFDGFSSGQKNQEQLLTLASILREEGKVFDEKVYYTAGYNSPFKLLDRNNEVWLIQKNEPSKEREWEKERKVYWLGQNFCLTGKPLLNIDLIITYKQNVSSISTWEYYYELSSFPLCLFNAWCLRYTDNRGQDSINM